MESKLRQSSWSTGLQSRMSRRYTVKEEREGRLVEDGGADF